MSKALADWQVIMYLMPLVENFPDVSRDGWLPPTLPGPQLASAREILGTYLGMPWTMAENWDVFGPEDGNRIDVIQDGGAAATLAVRFDARNDSPQFQGLVCRLARQLDCQLFCAELNALIQADRLALRMALADIHHASFLLDS